ncbi:MAG: biopolymer transporter ExbD [Gammaproteobacteria bacterium]|jgi:biopolymer transport protein ExbD
MARRHHYRRRTKETPELDVTTFLNLMVVLVPFLLITAVFSRLTIVELNLPSSSGGSVSTEPNFRLEVIVREAGLEITNGNQVIAAIPKQDDEYDIDTLSDYMVNLKRQYQNETAASVLLEPLIPYDYLIQVMDVVRSVELPVSGDELLLADNGISPADVPSNMDQSLSQQVQMVALFPDISVGEAP